MKTTKTTLKKLSAYGSLAVLILLLAFSWIFLRPDSDELSESLHGALQENFESSISQHIKQRHPQIQGIDFQKIQTENTDNPDRVNISFSYLLSVKDDAGDSEILIDGTAVLVRKSSNRWTLTDFKVTDSFLEFSEPLVIKAESTEDPTF